MSFETIFREIEPFFRYATQQNPSQTVTVWGGQGIELIQTVYQNCVSCNTRRFQDAEMTNLRNTANYYFCNTCNERVVRLFDVKRTEEERTVLKGIWDLKIHLSNREVPFARL